MTIARKIPWRKLKAVGLLCVVIFALHMVWSLLGDQTFVRRSKQAGSLLFRPNGQLLPQFIRRRDVCKKIVPFRKLSGGVISTFDLPEITDYSLDENGRYKIPSRNDQKNNLGARHTINVTLVTFSHADPGYGMTFEEYYLTRIKSKNMNLLFGSEIFMT